MLDLKFNSRAGGVTQGFHKQRHLDGVWEIFFFQDCLAINYGSSTSKLHWLQSSEPLTASSYY